MKKYQGGIAVEKAIGEIFDYEGIKLKVTLEIQSCQGCHFEGMKCAEDKINEIIGRCFNRRDCKSIIFQVHYEK